MHRIDRNILLLDKKYTKLFKALINSRDGLHESYESNLHNNAKRDFYRTTFKQCRSLKKECSLDIIDDIIEGWCEQVRVLTGNKLMYFTDGDHMMTDEVRNNWTELIALCEDIIIDFVKLNK